MLDGLKKLLTGGAAADREAAETEALHQAVGTLLYEVARMDYDVKPEDLLAVRAALEDLLHADAATAQRLVDRASAAATRLTSYHEAVSAINDRFSMEQKIRFIEHMWRVAHADQALDEQEDHLVRKISDLIYVPHIQCMLARQRARGDAPSA